MTCGLVSGLMSQLDNSTTRLRTMCLMLMYVCRYGLMMRLSRKTNAGEFEVGLKIAERTNDGDKVEKNREKIMMMTKKNTEPSHAFRHQKTGSVQTEHFKKSTHVACRR